MHGDNSLLIAIVGIYANAAATVVAAWLWAQQKRDDYLLFWSLFWLVGTLRWIIHLPAETLEWVRMIEAGIIVPLMCVFIFLGSYELLPVRPVRRAYLVAGMGAIFCTAGIGGYLVQRPMEVSYALVGGMYLIASLCMARAYRGTGLSGHALAALTLFAWGAWFFCGLFWLGGGITRTIVGPLFNMPMAFSLVVIVFQRRGRQLAGNEALLQKIFDTAPTPLIVARPPHGEIERANALAFNMLGITQQAAVGHTTVEQGIIPDVAERAAIYALLESGQVVRNQTLTMLRHGQLRTVSINAERIVLEGGDRFIFSFFDLTELKLKEVALREAGEEMRELYVRLANVEDEERRMLHAELHDQVGANLSALRLELDVLAAMLAQHGDSRVQRHLVNAREVASETIAAARDLMAELRPPALDDFGLLAGLRIYAETQSLRLNMLIKVAGQEILPRPCQMLEDAMFRIAQEAVINAARHGAAGCVAIELGLREGLVVLTVTDDGAGFDPAAPNAGPDHWGLKNMRERARAVGGTLYIESAPGAGARVSASAPLEPA